MSDPLPPDPYVALGISRDADTETIKKTHRKLVLKHHPDRIKDPARQEAGKNEFTKVQLAYELLIDEEKRATYDKEYRLAELRRERLMGDAVRAFATSYSPRASSGHAPASTPRRESRPDVRYQYEDRTPNSYFDVPRNGGSVYEEPLPRPNARKADSLYERDRKTSASRTSDKKKEDRSRQSGISAHVNIRLKEKVAQVREEVRKSQARAAKVRDQEERREREHKRTQSSHYSAYVHDDSDSDSDTIVSRSRQPRPAAHRTNTARARQELSPEPPRRRQQSSELPRPNYFDGDVDDVREDDLWKDRHGEAASYINKSMKRPNMPPRQGSDAYLYIYREGHRPGSGSDSDKRPTSSHRSHRQFMPEDYAPRPNMTSSNTAPSRLRTMVDEMSSRGTPHSRNSWSSKDTLKGDMDLPHRPRRTPSEPSPANLQRRDTNTRGSNLKTEINHDSGYGSGSNPQSPGLRGESPPPPEPARPSLARETSRVYKIGKAAADDSGRSRLREMPGKWFAPGMQAGIKESKSRRDSSRNRGSGDELKDRRRGGSRERGRDSGEDRERSSRNRRSSVDSRVDSRDSGRERRSSREPESRPRSTKTSHVASERRPSIGRTESSKYEARKEASRLYGEVTPSRDRGSSFRPVHTANIKTASYSKEPARSHYTPSSFRYTDHDERSSTVGISSRPSMDRRGSVY